MQARDKVTGKLIDKNWPFPASRRCWLRINEVILLNENVAYE